MYLAGQIALRKLSKSMECRYAGVVDKLLARDGSYKLVTAASVRKGFDQLAGHGVAANNKYMGKPDVVTKKLPPNKPGYSSKSDQEDETQNETVDWNKPSRKNWLRTGKVPKNDEEHADKRADK